MGVCASLTPTEISQSHYLFPFSGSNKDALRQMVQDHETYLKKKPENLADLSYTLTMRREPLRYRAFSVVSGQKTFEPFRVSQFVRSEEISEVSFVFTGQGAQWAQMGADLFESSLTFRQSIEDMETVLRNCSDRADWSLKRGYRKHIA